MRLMLLLLCIVPGFAADEKRAMTVDDALAMKTANSILFHPTQNWIFYGISELNWEKNKRDSTYYKQATDGSDAWQFIGKEGGSSFAFSPKGTWLSFTRSVDKKRQIFLMRTDGGEAVQLTKHKGGVGAYRWSQDESKIVFTADAQWDKDKEKEFKNGDDAIFVDEGPNGQTSARWRHLWLFDVKSKEETQITKGEIRVGGFDISPDNSRIVYTARTENRRNQGNLSELYLVTTADKLVTRLTENEAPEGNPRWAPNGRDIAYTAVDGSSWELEHDKLWVMNADTRETKEVGKDFEGNLTFWEWAKDSKSILFAAQWRVDDNLYRLELPRGKVKQLTEWEGNFSMGGFNGDQSQFIVYKDNPTSPRDIYLCQTDGSAEPKKLTDLNPGVADTFMLAQTSTITWKSKDGMEIEGMLVLPENYRKGTRIPLMLVIHGGPASNFDRRFNTSDQIYTGMGFAMLKPNVRGSSAYGDKLLRGNMFDIGGGDFEDLMTGVDHLIKEGIADENRLALTGWSYGGILGGWTVTQTNRFKAASVGAMVSDWTSEYGPGFNYDVKLWYIGGTPWENPEEWRNRSALTHVGKVQTPTIILHGMRDTTCTEPQSMMFFAALKDRGVPVRYLRFPREPHGLREPRHQRTRIVEEARWMQKHVLDNPDWEAWPIPSKDKKDDDKEKQTESE